MAVADKLFMKDWKLYDENRIIVFTDETYLRNLGVMQVRMD